MAASRAGRGALGIRAAEARGIAAPRDRERAAGASGLQEAPGPLAPTASAGARRRRADGRRDRAPAARTMGPQAAVSWVQATGSR